MQHSSLILPPTGHFRLEVRRKGVIVEVMDEPNLVVDGWKQTGAHLIGGDVTNRSITQIGFGTSGTAPAAGNTGLTGAYMKALGAVSYPTSASVAFAFTLASGEDNGMAIMEFGLFTAGSVLVARKVRTTALNKDTDLSLSGSWTLTF